MIQASETSSFSFRRSISNYIPRSNTSRTEDISRLTVAALLEVLPPIILNFHRPIWLASSKGSKRVVSDAENYPSFVLITQ
ncbi:hypothetical protein PAHAL_1G336900 [Panicum hallii]|uniref:Uncharacterized protein n=1 Tax=Panicum hallii TaxID=206008 RepID=A0A2T8KX36_9POAL|nr:hypothetical protein PAHAL_1G336900 [Panicum hallii]